MFDKGSLEPSLSGENETWEWTYLDHPLNDFFPHGRSHLSLFTDPQTITFDCKVLTMSDIINLPSNIQTASIVHLGHKVPSE